MEDYKLLALNPFSCRLKDMAVALEKKNKEKKKLTLHSTSVVKEKKEILEWLA